MNDKICTYCGRTGHRASSCFEAKPWRVWPDGTVQAPADGPPAKPGAYRVVWAKSEQEAKRHA